MLLTVCDHLAQTHKTGNNMRTRSKLLLTALITALALTAIAGTASANRLSISEQGFTSIWGARQLKFTGSGLEIECEVTLEGSFHYRTFLKTRSLVGHVNKVIIGAQERCRRNGVTSVRVLGTNAEGRLTTPWHLLYDSFTGRLPRITGIRLALVGAEFLLAESIFSESCLYRSTSARPAFGIVRVNEATGAVTGLEADSSSAIPYSSGGFGFCPSEGSFSGLGAATGRGGAGVITVRLI